MFQSFSDRFVLRYIDRGVARCGRIQTMKLTADSKGRVVLPGAAPGDVFTFEENGPELILRRVHRAVQQRKQTKAEVLKAIRNWRNVPNIRWEELGAMTREP